MGTTPMKPGISPELQGILFALIYGVVVGAGLMGLAWWLT
jgi:tetrahydromethanopterin S-methyltransferase subunit B